MLSGEDVNQILSVVFINEPMVKKPRTRVSPNKPLNPQPIASVVPHTHSVVKESPIIHIQDDPEPETFPSTRTMSPFFLQGRALGPPQISSSYNFEMKMVKEFFANPLKG
jgi:hypothetical protein